MTDENIFNVDITDNDLLAILNKPTKKTKQTRQYTEEAQVAMKERLKRMREKSLETRKANAEVKKTETPNIKPSKKDTNEKMIELLGTMNSNMSELVKMKQSKVKPIQAVQPIIQPIQSQPKAVQPKPIEPIQPKPIQAVQPVQKPPQPIQPKPPQIVEPVVYNYPYPLKNKIISKY